MALHSLDPNGDWKNKFLVLDKKDVRPVGKQKGQSEGHRELSWIWLSDPVQDPAANTQGQVDLNEGKRNLSWINMASSHWCSLRRASRGMGYVSLACRTLGGREGVREGRNDTGPYQLQGSCEVVGALFQVEGGLKMKWCEKEWRRMRRSRLIRSSRCVLILHHSGFKFLLTTCSQRRRLGLRNSKMFPHQLVELFCVGTEQAFESAQLLLHRSKTPLNPPPHCKFPCMYIISFCKIASHVV